MGLRTLHIRNIVTQIILKKYSLKLIYKFCAFFLGCFSTFFIATNFDLSAVIVSAAVGLLSTFIPIDKKYHTVIYSGSFAGMCSQSILTSYNQIFILSFIGAILYLSLASHFKGLGGKLGTIAFLSVALTYLIGSLI